ncbi:MAG: hypothetical protein ABIX28_13625 [Vicinamibacterales bacterium]
MRATAIVLLSVLALLAPAAHLAAQPGMPDLSQMSGVPLPVTDVAVGTVTVRVIRGSLANVVPGQSIELVVGGATRTATTNEQGRAEFTELVVGTTVKARTVVDGAALESQAFQVPASGGVRLMLVAGLAGKSDAATAPSNPSAGPLPSLPARPGTVSLGDQTRFVFEMGDDALTGFYILQVVNSTPAPAEPPMPLTIELPEGAQGATIMQGSSPQGSVAGTKVVIAGPFAPGSTQVQVAFTLPYTGARVEVEQPLPVALAAVTILVEKVGAMRLESPQIAQSRDIQAQADTYLLGQGPAINTGGRLAFTISGLRHHPLWPRNLALGLAALVLVAGLWASARPARAVAAEEARRQKLMAKRDKLFAELAGLEAQRARGLDEARYDAQRSPLIQALERIYVELGEDLAA